jgi:hypothetical protein
VSRKYYFAKIGNNHPGYACHSQSPRAVGLGMGVKITPVAKIPRRDPVAAPFWLQFSNSARNELSNESSRIPIPSDRAV